MPSTFPRLLAAFLLAAPTALSAQDSGFDLNYGYWWHRIGATSLTVHYQGHLLGPVGYGLGLVHLHSFTEPESVRQTGGEISLALGRSGPGPYVVGAVGLVMGHASGEVTALWSAGAGWSVSPLRFLSLGVEGRYQVEDSQIHGFWRLHPDDLRGFALAGRVAVQFGGGAPRSVPSADMRTPHFEPPPSPSAETGALGTTVAAPDEPAGLRSMVVATALEAMGSPYRWGGSDSNGFDCSGLIQYAYGEQGLILPRTSRDQARAGMAVQRDVRMLLPGDILGFSIERGGVTHVGLYVGDGMFIHSASGGVKLSSLAAGDPDNRWWQQRWVSARRVVN